MTIIEGLKRIKHLDRKIEKNRKRIARWCSYFSNEEPAYDAEGLRKLIQATEDMIRHRNTIRHAIHKTNILTTVNFQHKNFTLDELIILRTLTLPELVKTLHLLKRREKGYGAEKDVKVILSYDPNKRDQEIDSIENLMDELDSVLDSLNISTSLIE